MPLVDFFYSFCTGTSAGFLFCKGIPFLNLMVYKALMKAYISPSDPSGHRSSAQLVFSGPELHKGREHLVSMFFSSAPTPWKPMCRNCCLLLIKIKTLLLLQVTHEGQVLHQSFISARLAIIMKRCIPSLPGNPKRLCLAIRLGP